MFVYYVGCEVVASMFSDHIAVSVFFFKQKTAYEMRISDWSSDVCLPISRIKSGVTKKEKQKHAHPPHQRRRLSRARHGGARSDRAPAFGRYQIGRASCRERVCKYV